MPTTPRIPILATTLLLSALLTPAALAGDTGTGRTAPERSTTGSAVSDQPAMPQAPIGHRQPRAAELPADTSPSAEDAWMNRVNRDIDSKLTICRRC
jgi:hypothetical protein